MQVVIGCSATLPLPAALRLDIVPESVAYPENIGHAIGADVIAEAVYWMVVISAQRGVDGGQGGCEGGDS
jgi:hypothetical protein